MAGEFPSNDQVQRAVDDFIDALKQVTYTKYHGFWATPIDSIMSLTREPDVGAAAHDLTESCRPALEIQPGGFHDNADALTRALALLDQGEPDSRGFFEGYKTAAHQLSGWQGRAADAFRLELDRIEGFVIQQAQAMTRAAGRLIAAYQVCSLARVDLISVFHSGADACRAMEKTNDAQHIQAALFVGAGLASGTLNYLTTTDRVVQALAASAQTIGTTTTVDSAGIAGSDPQDILDSVSRAQHDVVDRMHAAWADLANKANDDSHVHDKTPPPTVGPPPPYTDVHDPAFRYSDFSSPWRSTRSFGDIAHRAAASPDPAGPGSIRRALG